MTIVRTKIFSNFFTICIRNLKTFFLVVHLTLEHHDKVFFTSSCQDPILKVPEGVMCHVKTCQVIFHSWEHDLVCQFQVMTLGGCSKTLVLFCSMKICKTSFSCHDCFYSNVSVVLLQQKAHNKFIFSPTSLKLFEQNQNEYHHCWEFKFFKYLY